MIKVNELRIGNFISDDDGVLAKVIGLMPFEHSTRCDEEEGCQILVDCYHANGARRTGCVTDSPDCNPIPLTHEWMERLGYTKDSTDKKWYRSPYVLPPVYCWRMGDYGMDGLPLSAKSFQYVHQLQNLYFALTGEELTIKN